MDVDGHTLFGVTRVVSYFQNRKMLNVILLVDLQHGTLVVGLRPLKYGHCIGEFADGAD